MRNFNRIVPSTLLAVGLFTGTAGCGESKSAEPSVEINDKYLLNTSKAAIVHPGEAIMVEPVTDETLRNTLCDAIDLIDHQYPKGFEDRDAATVRMQPIRVDAHVALDGKNPELSNDIASDAVWLDMSGFEDTSSVYLGAVALSGDGKDEVMVSWPLAKDGTPGEFAYISMDDGNEPSGGVVLFLSDIQR